MLTPFLTRNGTNQRTACARSVKVCPHVCCQFYNSAKYQVSISNTVTEATRFGSKPTNIHKYPCSVSCHAPRCSIPSQHIPHQMRLSELPQSTLSIKSIAGTDKTCLKPRPVCTTRACLVRLDCCLRIGLRRCVRSCLAPHSSSSAAVFLVFPSTDREEVNTECAEVGVRHRDVDAAPSSGPTRNPEAPSRRKPRSSLLERFLSATSRICLRARTSSALLGR